MKIKKITTYILGFISLASAFIASGIKEFVGWEDTARPFFIIWFVSLIIALVLVNIDNIRRYTYPSTICIMAWLHAHKVLNTTFSKSTYTLYKQVGKSYGKLFDVVQTAFEDYLVLKEGL